MPEEVTQGGLAASSYAERTEHAEISSVHGKKVFNVDSSGNLVNPATSENQTNGSQKTQIVETVPTDTTKFNASTLISYNANDEAVYIDETFEGITYRTTFTRSDMVVASTLPISAVTIL